MSNKYFEIDDEGKRLFITQTAMNKKGTFLMKSPLVAPTSIMAMCSAANRRTHDLH